MGKDINKFINTIGVLARNEYLSRTRAILPSICIAQAGLESGWDLSAKTLFGIKGPGIISTTSECYNGDWVIIQDSFRTYPSIASSVCGYYDFLASTPRYAKAINERDYRKAVDGLIHTLDGKPYATDPLYINKIIKIIEQYNLTKWDVIDTVYGGIDYSAVYDPKFYNENHPDLQKAFNGDTGFLIKHFVDYGMREGRQAKQDFNVKLYMNNYKDLRDAFGDDLPFYYLHYITYGKKEGRLAI